MPPRTYSKTFIPLESNPEIFTSLAHNLGASSSLKFTEVYSLDERPSNGEVLAYILVFPTSEDYEDNREREGGKEGGRSGKEEGEKEGGGEDVIWLRQTIHNACGLYALLHACCNGRARRSIKPGSILDELINTPANQRTHFLDTCSELEQFYAEAADQGDTQPPENGVEVDWHYTCFLASVEKHKLYELDGDKLRPLYHADLDPSFEDFDAKAVGLISRYFEQAEEGKEVQFSVMALVDASSVL